MENNAIFKLVRQVLEFIYQRTVTLDTNKQDKAFAFTSSLTGDDVAKAIVTVDNNGKATVDGAIAELEAGIVANRNAVDAEIADLADDLGDLEVEATGFVEAVATKATNGKITLSTSLASNAVLPVGQLEGVINVANLPKVALGDLFVVANETAMKAIKSGEPQSGDAQGVIRAQAGDTVKFSTGEMFYVTTQNVTGAIANNDGDLYFVKYTATADWAAITSKPDALATLTGAGKIDASYIDGVLATLTTQEAEAPVADSDTVDVAIAKLVAQLDAHIDSADATYVKLSSQTSQAIASDLAITGAVSFSTKPTVGSLEQGETAGANAVVLKRELDAAIASKDEASEILLSSSYTTVDTIAAGDTVESAIGALDTDVSAIKAAFQDFATDYSVPVNG